MSVKIALAGFNEKPKKVMTAFLQSKKSDFLTLADSEHEAMLIDADTAAGIQQWNDNKLSMPIIAISTTELASELTIWIQKPASVEKLNIAAKQLTELIIQSRKPSRSSAAQNNDVVNSLKRDDKWSDIALKNSVTNNSSQKAFEHFDAEKTLQGIMQKALQYSEETQSPVIVSYEGKLIEINKEEDLVRSSFNEKTLRTLCRFKLNRHNTTFKKGTIPNSIRTQNYTVSHFFWEIGLDCSRGRLPNTLDESQRYKLSFWPNLTRWQSPQHSLRISSLWSHTPLTAIDVAKQLDISTAYVIAFLAAADSSGLIQHCDEITNTAPVKQPHEARSALKSFFNKLKWN